MFLSRYHVWNVNEKVVHVTARYQGIGAVNGALTKLNGRGVASVTRTAAGQYSIALVNAGEKFLGGSIMVTNAAGTVAAQKCVNPVGAPAYTSGTKTLTVQVTDLTTPAVQDLASNEEIWLDLIFADTDVPGV